MPYVDSGLPFNGSTPLSLHTSRAGAKDAEQRSTSQTIRYIEALTDAVDGLTDAEAAKVLGIPLASVCARRAPLRKAGLIFCEGTRPGPTGIGNAIWRWRR
jgi:hypothetical protein